MQFVTEPDRLVIALQGWEKVWALKKQLDVPRAAILEVDFLPEQPVLRDFRGFLRLPGIFLPGVFLAGSYQKRGEREFWYLHQRQAGVLTLTLRPQAITYNKIRVSCTPEIAQSVADWWRTVVK